MSDEPEAATMLWLVSVAMSGEAAMMWLVSVMMSGEAEFSPALKDA